MYHFVSSSASAPLTNCGFLFLSSSRSITTCELLKTAAGDEGNTQQQEMRGIREDSEPMPWESP